MTSDPDRIQVLVVSARERVCAIRISQLGETMRPLPISTLGGAPAYVLGVALIRGVATPVVDLGAALGESSAPRITRFLTIKNGPRRLALAVDALVGVQHLSAASLRPLPSHLQLSTGEKIEAVGAIGEQLLFVVDPLHLAPPQLWATLNEEAA